MQHSSMYAVAKCENCKTLAIYNSFKPMPQICPTCGFITTADLAKVSVGIDLASGANEAFVVDGNK